MIFRDVPCTPWWGNVDPVTGYGREWNRKSSTGFLAHRLAYEQTYGPIPDGYAVDHLCHNADQDCPGGPCEHRRCINPLHLEAVPNGVNVLRGKTLPALNVRKTHCPAGHEYSPENTYLRSSKTGQKRICRACRSRVQREYLARKASA